MSSDLKFWATVDYLNTPIPTSFISDREREILNECRNQASKCSIMTGIPSPAYRYVIGLVDVVAKRKYDALMKKRGV